jgi:hypothetical protein
MAGALLFSPQVPSLQQSHGWIAQLGGFLGRTRDGNPGPMSVWRGLQCLSDIAEAWLVFHSPYLVGKDKVG